MLMRNDGDWLNYYLCRWRLIGVVCLFFFFPYSSSHTSFCLLLSCCIYHVCSGASLQHLTFPQTWNLLWKNLTKPITGQSKLLIAFEVETPGTLLTWFQLLMRTWHKGKMLGLGFLCPFLQVHNRCDICTHLEIYCKGLNGDLTQF